MVLKVKPFFVGISGFVAVIIILIISTVLGAGVLLLSSLTFEWMKPAQGSYKLIVMCYRIDYSSTLSESNANFICLVRNPIDYNITLSIITTAGKYEFYVPSSTVQPLNSSSTRQYSYGKVIPIQGKILYAEAKAKDFYGKLEVEVVYR